MKAGSLRFRLLGLAGVSIVLSLIAAGLLLNYLFTSNMERSAREEMRASLSRLVALIDVDPETPTLISPMPDPRYDTPMGGRVLANRSSRQQSGCPVSLALGCADRYAGFGRSDVPCAWAGWATSPHADAAGRDRK